MAAEMGLSPEILETEAFPPDKVLKKSKPHSGLMERLRSRCSQHKSWTDSVKAIRMAIANDKRLQADALEKSSIQNCLDKLHRAMKITNQQSLIERLDLISRQLGMIFTPPSHSDNQVVLSSEMFKVVVMLEGQSGIKDVKVGHQETPVSCEDLVEVLSKGNFEEFVSHLQGLLAIYSIHGDRKQKNKGYLALSSLEHDLNQLAQLQSSINGVANYIHKSPLGILLPRRGGHPMKLIYFVSPYDLLCKKSISSYPMTVEAITENGLGHSVTVSLEPCPHVNKLQTIPLMTVRQNQDGKSLPSFQNVNNINSYSLSASFVLVLPQPIPVAKSVIDAIKDITGLDVISGEEKSFLSVLLLHNSNASMSNGNELFVTLPDQQHVYYFNNSVDGCLGQPGALVNKIPFTLPTCVPKVLNLLRQQLMFNSVIHSLIRPNSKREYRSGVVFELTAVSLQYLSLMFEHPLHHSMITVEFDLSDLTSVHCNVNMNNKDENICSDDFVSKAFQRSFSIPVTLRSVIKKVNEQIKLLAPPQPVVKPLIKSRWTWTRPSPVKKSPIVNTNTSTVPTQNMVSNFPNPPPYQNAEGWTPTQTPQIEMHKYSIQYNQTPLSEPPVPAHEEFHEQRPAANPLLATLLDAGSPTVVEQPAVPVVNESPMLSKLLEENTSVASNPFPAPNPNPRKRLTKRKSSKDIAGKSPKQRISDSEMVERTCNERVGSERHGQGMGEKHIDLDSSGGSYEELARPSSVSSVGSVGGQSTGSVIDLTDIGESHVKKLENSLDSIMGKESPRSGAMMGMGHPLNSQMSGLDMLDMYPTDFHHGQNQNQFMGDGSVEFHPPNQWPSRQTPPTPTSRNSPHHGVVPKNEKTSTSLEELLLGPGGREIEGPNSAHTRRNSHQRRPNFKRQNSLSRNSVDSASGVISPDVFSPLMTSPGHHPLASPGQFPISSPNYIVSPGIYPQMSPSHIPPVTSPSLQNISIKSEPSDSKAGILGSQTSISTSRISNVHVGHVTSCGKPSLSMMKAQFDIKNDVKPSVSAITQEREGFKEENSNSSTNSQPPLMKLKLTNMKQYDNVSPADSDTSKRSSTFDFHSDDEDFSLPMVEKMTVVSASPTRLQISNKSTLASFNRFNKSEKFKRKQRESELKITLSVDSGKRKREKNEESKKERKKKKMANSSYSVENEMAVYKSITVDNVSSQNDHLPKLKITKKGLKMSVENSVLRSKEDKAIVKSDKLDKSGKEPVVKIEKMEKSLTRETSEKEIKSSKDKSSKQKEKNSDKEKTCASVTRTPSASDEGIFDKINAMKSENASKSDNPNTAVEKNSSHDGANKKSSSSSSKSLKSHKSQRGSSSSKSDSKMARTPTIKLKPIVVPASSSGLTVSRNPSTPSTPSTPKSITQSPTSATIGKIGAVSLATSGSQKQLTPNSSKSPQGSASKSSGPSSKSSSGSSSTPSSKSSSGMQKNFQIQGPSGKNSPIPQSSKSGHSRSSSTSTLNSGSSALKLDKSKSISSSSIRTSSPHSEKEKSKSSSRSSSASGRDREKSTSSSKTSVPTTTVITQETAASVLSFLNPNKIAKLPPIPKLSSTAGSQKVSTPTSTNNPIVSTSTAPTYSSTSTTNSKFSKGSNPVTSVSKGNSSSTTTSTSKSSISSANHVKNNYIHNKTSSGSSSSRTQNQLVTNAANSNRNSPQSYSHKHDKGSSNSYNKGNNQSSSSNSSSGHRNNYNGGNNQQNRNSGVHNSNSHSNWSNSSGSANSHSKNSSSNSNQRGSNSSHSGNKGSNSNSDNAISRTTVSNSSNISNSKGSNSVPNAPKGPGPPASRQQSTEKGNSGNNTVNSAAAARGRKGSLSAVIDKLTCKASVPTSSSSSQKVNQVIVNESPASPEMDMKENSKVVIFEAPASPEPENCVNSAPKHRINSAREIVSIPLENEPENTNDNSYVSKQTGNKFKNNSERKKDNSFSKGSVTLNSSPKIIPLNSPKEKPSAHRNSPINKKCGVKQGGADLVNSIDKQNGEIDEHHNKHTNVSSNDITNNSYSNSQSDLPVNDAKAKDNVFKTPASKPQENSDINTEDIENLGGRRNFRQNSMSKTMSDPSSPASSPENGLIIDFPSSPRHLQNKTNSPQCNPVSDTFIENRTSPNFLKSPGMKSKLKTSPPCSPSGKDSSLGSSTNSPEALEDDLMDEALGFGN
ncbi:mediator of RNA polymerase II transcription subunit 1-like [Mercenaria mercenaria]|uniref:mediator of RNA polymerase II transcription subunit 1-like n=1 Tax=Mercenaria mercenaria TaxID=6596 RepID=UPI00234F1199|nr:mediator of RNA polymerase II transcription subunit 1-like [Mercenaria mercenaria]